MGIKKPKINVKITERKEKVCEANKQTIVFSFEYLTEIEDFNFHYYDKDSREGIKVFNELTQKLSLLSQKTWEELNNTGKRNGGEEKMTVGEFKTRFANSLKHVTKDETVYIVRFNKDKRLFFRRGRHCKRVAQILACEFKLGLAYDHGS